MGNQVPNSFLMPPGAATWRTTKDLTVGSLTFHPTDPDIVYVLDGIDIGGSGTTGDHYSFVAEIIDSFGTFAFWGDEEDLGTLASIGRSYRGALPIYENETLLVSFLTDGTLGNLGCAVWGHIVPRWAGLSH